MKALTIWQPWASLIIIGAKPYEFRGHRPPQSMIGEPLVIHAGKRELVMAEVLELIERLGDPAEAWTTCLHKEKALPLLRDVAAGGRLPTSAGLGIVKLGAPKGGWDIAQEWGGHPALVNDSDREGHANWGWPMNEVERWAEPIPARGAQGLWNWTGGDVEKFARLI